MARYVVIKAGKVVNVVEWDGVSPWAPPNDGSIAAPHATAGIGWDWNNGAPTDLTPTSTPLPQIDLSNIDNLDRTFRAFGLLLRDYTNSLQAGTYTQKTVAQLKADFAAKYSSLP